MTFEEALKELERLYDVFDEAARDTTTPWLPAPPPPVPDTEESESRGMPSQDQLDRAWARRFAKGAEEDGIAVPQNLVGAGYDVHMSESRGVPDVEAHKHEAKKRKEQPLYSGCFNYFPDALIAVAEVSFLGNQWHNPGQPLHWDRSKSMDQHDALLRHLTGAGTIDTDGVRHSAKVAWRALAALQLEIEAAR